jgi:uncharacterized membrane protein YdbT with pleckstrin-like domain
MHRITLHEGEEILEKHRQTALVLLPSVLVTAVVGLYAFYFLAKYSLVQEFLKLTLFFFFIIVLFVARKVLVWWLNEYLITNQRLIRISHEGLFKKLVVETPLERILNVSFKTTGFWSSMLSYGDVEVQVVGLMEPVLLRHIAEPAHIKDYLWQLHQSKAKEPHSFEAKEIPHVQERLGYTKENQKIL